MSRTAPALGPHTKATLAAYKATAAPPSSILVPLSASPAPPELTTLAPEPPPSVSHCAASPSKGSSTGGPCRGEAAAHAVCVRPRALFRLQSSLEFVLRCRPPCRFAIRLRRPSTRPGALDEFAVWPSLSQSKPCAKSISIARDRASSPEFPRAPPLVGVSAATVTALSVASCPILSQRIRSNGRV